MLSWNLHIIYVYTIKLTDDTDLLKNSADLQKVESHDLTTNSSTECKDDESGFSKFPLEKVCADSWWLSFFLVKLVQYKELKFLILLIIIPN